MALGGRVVALVQAQRSQQVVDARLLGATAQLLSQGQRLLIVRGRPDPIAGVSLCRGRCCSR